MATSVICLEIRRLNTVRLLVALLRVNRGSSLYGGERSTLELLDALSTEGITTDIIQWDSSSLPIKGHALHDYRINGRKDPGWLNLSFAVSSLASQTKPDYIYAYAEYFPETIVAVTVASILSRKRLLVSVLDDKQKEVDKLTIAGVFSTRLSNERSLRSSLRYTVFQLIRRIAVRYLGITLVSTESVARYAKESLKASRVVKMGRGVDKNWFGRNSSQLDFDTISVGGLRKNKRVDVLIRAWSKVMEEISNARLVIVGDGKELQRLRNLADELGILQNITFKGYEEDPAKIRSLLSRSKVFVSTSQVEGYGRSAAEANAVGLPCVLTDIPVFRELYSNSAILVKLGEPSILARAILDLLKNETKYNELSIRTRENAALLSWEAVAKRLVSQL